MIVTIRIHRNGSFDIQYPSGYRLSQFSGEFLAVAIEEVCLSDQPDEVRFEIAKDGEA